MLEIEILFLSNRAFLSMNSLDPLPLWKTEVQIESFLFTLSSDITVNCYCCRGAWDVLLSILPYDYLTICYIIQLWQPTTAFQCLFCKLL